MSGPPAGELVLRAASNYRAAVDRRGVTAVAIGVVVAVIFAVNVTSGPVELAGGQPSAGVGSIATSTGAMQVPPIEIGIEIDERDPGEIPDVVVAALRLLFYALLVMIAVLAVRFLWRNRPQLRWPQRRRAPAPFDVLDDVVAAAVASDASAQRAALQRGAPRNAIVECWLRLERTVIEAGVAPVASDTSAEFTERVLAAQQVDHDALVSLAALYREARFSDHEMNEAARRRAIDALDALHASLDRPRVEEAV